LSQHAPKTGTRPNGDIFPFQGERKYRIHENLISVKQNMKTLTVKITRDVLAGRVANDNSRLIIYRVYNQTQTTAAQVFV
jgi:hypothetical protein